MTQDLLLPDVGMPSLEYPRGLRREERIKQMHGVYGVGPAGKKCKTCAHLFKQGKARFFLKCNLNKVTNGPATDWRAGYQACGRYEEAK